MKHRSAMHVAWRTRIKEGEEILKQIKVELSSPQPLAQLRKLQREQRKIASIMRVLYALRYEAREVARIRAARRKLNPNVEVVRKGV